MNNVSEQMRSDWNDRALEDAHYYVAFGGRNQDEEGFLATAKEVLGGIEWELKRLPRNANRRTWRALEIGCGPGRLMKPLSKHFGEIHGVDVSDEMVKIARQRLRDIPHAHAHATNGASLAMFADESFDLVYTYAVFQHIPSRDVVLEYIRETARVLKPGGIFRGQFNALPPSEQPDTWGGVSFSGQEIREFTAAHGLQLMALDGDRTQYMWTTWRKAAGPATAPAGPVSIRRITNAWSSETVAPARGVLAALSIWAVDLPAGCDLNSLEVIIDGRPGSVVYVGHTEFDGMQQVNAMIPEGTRTGLLPVELHYGGHTLGPQAYVRVIPSGPLVPRILSITDGVNIVHENRSSSGSLKIQLDEVRHPELLAVDIDGLLVRRLETFCKDPLPPRYEVNCLIPEGLPPGRHDLRVHIGKRVLMPREIEVSS